MSKEQKKFFIEVMIQVLCIILFTIWIVVVGKPENPDSIPLETERKWIIDVDNIPYNLDTADRYEITQTYINFSPEIRVREIGCYRGDTELGTYYTMTIKRYINEDVMTRQEVDMQITQDEYNNMLLKKDPNGETIYKTRYQIEVDDLTYAFDIFKDQLDGLAYLEIEFNSEEEANAFKQADWMIKDVTNDRGYKNQSLAKFGMPE